MVPMPYFPSLKLITQAVSWVLIFVLLGGLSYVIFNNVTALQYGPENVVKRFITLIENPTQTVTDEEKKELGQITQSNFLSNWGNENNIKTLRRISQQKPIIQGGLNYTGESRKYATTELNFQNDFKNPESKKAKLYLERYGEWYSGLRWRIYQIDMPREDNLLDNIQNQTDQTGKNAEEAVKSLQDRLRDLFGG
jgi:hypothetical protein